MKDKGFKTLLVLNILLLVADFVSTLTCGRLIKYLEVNLAYKYGGLALILGINVCIFVWVYWLYTKPNSKVGDRFFIILSLCMIIGFRILAIYGNLTVAYVFPAEIAEYHNVSIAEAKEIQLQQAMETTEEMKREYAKDFVTPFIMPYICCLLVWFFYKPDHDIIKREQ